MKAYFSGCIDFKYQVVRKIHGNTMGAMELLGLHYSRTLKASGRAVQQKIVDLAIRKLGPREGYILDEASRRGIEITTRDARRIAEKYHKDMESCGIKMKGPRPDPAKDIARLQLVLECGSYLATENKLGSVLDPQKGVGHSALQESSAKAKEFFKLLKGFSPECQHAFFLEDFGAGYETLLPEVFRELEYEPHLEAGPWPPREWFTDPYWHQAAMQRRG